MFLTCNLQAHTCVLELIARRDWHVTDSKVKPQQALTRWVLTVQRKQLCSHRAVCTVARGAGDEGFC